MVYQADRPVTFWKFWRKPEASQMTPATLSMVTRGNSDYSDTRAPAYQQ